MEKGHNRIPLEFRARVSHKLRIVMKPHVRENRSLYAECKEVAKELNLHPQTVWFWYEGYCLPTLYNLVRFADLYDVSIDYLLGRTAIQQLAGQLKRVA